MTNKTAALRYARALFDVALAEHADLQRIESDLDSVLNTFSRHPELEKVLLSPAVPAPRKKAALEQLAARGGVQPVLGKLLALLAERDRLVILPEVLAAYRRRLLDHLKVVRAEITSAVPLTAERLKTVEGALARVTARSVTLTAAVDPALIGGLVARVGGTVYDASIKHHLARLRKTLE